MAVIIITMTTTELIKNLHVKYAQYAGQYMQALSVSRNADELNVLFKRIPLVW